MKEVMKNDRRQMVERMKLRLAEERYREARRIHVYTLPPRPLSEEYPTLFNFGITLAISGVFLVLINLL